MATSTRIRVSLFNGTDQLEPESMIAPTWPLRPASFVFSLLTHGGIVAALLLLPPAMPRQTKPVHAAVYKVIELKREPVIYWARVPAALPSVAPETQIGTSPVLRAEQRSPAENIVVKRLNADPSKQLVWQPDKPERLKTETPSQNLIAVQGKPTPKPFEPPKMRPPTVSEPKALTAPEAAPIKTELPANVAGLPALPIQKPKPKAFVAPKVAPKLPVEAGKVADAPPELGKVAVNLSASATALGTGALPKRPAPFVPPPSRGRDAAGQGEGKGLTAPPPELPAAGTGSAVTAAVIGLNPSIRMAELPDGSRTASFSRGQRTGEPASGKPGEGPVVPGVAIAANRSGATPLAPVVLPPSPSAPSRPFELNLPPSLSTVSAPLRPSSRTLPRSIEARFHDRVVYVLVIPRPNLPDYIGDWTIWFSDRSGDTTAASMRAPVPIRKLIRVDSPPTPLGGVEAWVQVAAVVGRNGKVSAISAVPGRNPAVAAKAAEDLANWDFRPASRNGEPVEVEIVVEIPYRAR